MIINKHVCVVSSSSCILGIIESPSIVSGPNYAVIVVPLLLVALLVIGIIVAVYVVRRKKGIVTSYAQDDFNFYNILSLKAQQSSQQEMYKNEDIFYKHQELASSANYNSSDSFFTVLH